MTKIISIHSFRGGTGKSNTTANLAAVIAAQGKRVAIIDTDIQSPGIHVLFGLDEGSTQLSLNDYLWGRCSLQDAAYEVTPAAIAQAQGKIFLVPCSIKMGEIARILKEGYNVLLLTQGLHEICLSLALDYLLIDTHPGMNEETLLSIAISNQLIVILRPDQQDFQGTAVTLQVAQKLNTPRISLLVNKLLPKYNPKEVQAQISAKFNTPVLGVFPVTEEMMDLGSKGIFVLEYPDNPYTATMKQVVEAITVGPAVS
ncbi:MAG TPA: MinD/ParA family protein [Leptolyngbyaceae cyanobacterium M65_K2018_010]|nr:MinD/ParA family protein [Leptolyngbyaceae cyanobacterium M65_K2018_010]